MELKIDFSGRSIHYTEEEIATVVEVMRSAPTLTQGEHMRNFETKFGEYIGASHCFAMMNGYSALEMSAQLCQFKPGDEVVIPAHTFTASAYGFLKYGATPVWADVDPCTHVVTAASIENVLTPRTKAIVVVHLYGYMADMPQIMDLATRRGILVIEDAAQSIGTEVDGLQSGSFGDLGVFSFHSHKNLTTLGEGGMLVVKDRTLAKIVPMLRHNGHCAYPKGRPYYWLPAMGDVQIPVLNGEQLFPHNFSLGEAECALGAKLLDRIDTINAEKRERALKFIDALADYPELVFLREPSTRHNYHLLVGSLQNGTRDKFIQTMFKDKGIKCVVQYCPLNRYPFYTSQGYSHADCPNGDAFYDSMISFPFQHWLTEEQFQYMLTSTREVLASLRV